MHQIITNTIAKFYRNTIRCDKPHTAHTSSQKCMPFLTRKPDKSGHYENYDETPRLNKSDICQIQSVRLTRIVVRDEDIVVERIKPTRQSLLNCLTSSLLHSKAVDHDDPQKWSTHNTNDHHDHNYPDASDIVRPGTFRRITLKRKMRRAVHCKMQDCSLAAKRIRHYAHVFSGVARLSFPYHENLTVTGKIVARCKRQRPPVLQPLETRTYTGAWRHALENRRLALCSRLLFRGLREWRSF